MADQKNRSLQVLLSLASKVTMTTVDKEAQRRSFAYGNTRIENDYVTRDMVSRLAESMSVDRKR